MEDNLRILDRVVDDLTTAARLLDEKRDRVRSIKYTAGIAAGAGTVLGAAGFLFTGGRKSLFVSVCECVDCMCHVCACECVRTHFYV